MDTQEDLAVLEQYNLFKVFTNISLNRATGPMLTSDKEEKHAILPTTLNFAVRRGKLRIYTLPNPPEVFWKFASPDGGYKEWAVVCFA